MDKKESVLFSQMDVKSYSPKSIPKEKSNSKHFYLILKDIIWKEDNKLSLMN